MATKKEIRQALICRLIRNNDVPNQKTLRELLLINGISATQATISRDMYELNITKDRYSREDISCYRMPSDQARTTQDVFRVMGTKGFRSIHYSGSFVVLKTRSGYAHSICVDIDSIANNPEPATFENTLVNTGRWGFSRRSGERTCSNHSRVSPSQLKNIPHLFIPSLL